MGMLSTNNCESLFKHKQRWKSIHYNLILSFILKVGKYSFFLVIFLITGGIWSVIARHKTNLIFLKPFFFFNLAVRIRFQRGDV